MLHTINKSPFENNSLESCLSLLAPDSSILFIEDAVIAAMQNTRFSSLVQSKLEAFKVYALQPDLDARGLDGEKVISGIEVIGYDDFVDLAVSHKSVQSWL
ncbi:MAG: sulfurtransferase complex subunit TusB [Gammaproteobacteria bacterium]|nr:sulfurtransferase complex subunit TusB [Gammaproteobacteria bacterium]